jgi:broad specificity phosphatase PhoE
LHSIQGTGSGILSLCATAIFEARIFKGAFVELDGAQIAYKQRIHVEWPCGTFLYGHKGVDYQERARLNPLDPALSRPAVASPPGFLALLPLCLMPLHPAGSPALVNNRAATVSQAWRCCWTAAFWPCDTMSRLIIVRHAQASFGGVDYDRLTPLGEEQARRLGTHWAGQNMVFDGVFIGPRRRHQRTAELVGASLRERGLPWPKMVTLPELDEYAGLEVFQQAVPTLPERQVSAKATPELLKLFQGVMSRWVRGELSVSGVETWTEFRVRARRGLETILAAGAGGQQIAVFTSTGPVAAALDLAVGLDDERMMEASWQVRNTAVSEFLFSAPRFSLNVFNALPHLPTGDLATHI